MSHRDLIFLKFKDRGKFPKNMIQTRIKSISETLKPMKRDSVYKQTHVYAAMDAVVRVTFGVIQHLRLFNTCCTAVDVFVFVHQRWDF